MNGMRRLLGGGGAQRAQSPPAVLSEQPPPPLPTKVTSPLVIAGKPGPSWPPSSLSQGTSPTTFLARNEGRPSLSDDGSRPQSYASISSPIRKSVPTSSTVDMPPANRSSSPMPSLSSPRIPLTPDRLSRKSIKALDSSPKRTSRFVDTRDQMLMSLLASEAVVDSRDSEILSAEEVEELKKENQILESRLGAMTKKLKLETKIRDAALSLSKVNAAHKVVSKQTSEQLDAANRKVEIAQKELWRVSERANEIQRKLLDHRAGVLSVSLRSLEAKVSGDADESRQSTPPRSLDMSPTSTTTNNSMTSKAKFEGAHLFAGHANSVQPASRKPLSAAEVAALEDKLREATGKLQAATKLQAETKREISHLRVEKEQVETSLGMELQDAREAISNMKTEQHRLESLEDQVQELLEERNEWESERIELEESRKEVELLERRLVVMEERSGDAVGMEALLMQVKEESQASLEQKDAEIRELKEQWEAQRTTWERHKVMLEEEKLEALNSAQKDTEGLRGKDQDALHQANMELQAGLELVRTLLQTQRVPHTSGDISMAGYISSLEVHMADMSSKMESHYKARDEWEARRRELEGDLKMGLDKRETLIQEVEKARREREEARNDVRALEGRVRDQSDRFSDLVTLKSTAPSSSDTNADLKKIVSVLQPVWAALPSPEARASKFGAGRRVNSPTQGPGSPGNAQASSISDLDVRSLKTLYDSRTNSSNPENSGTFSVEAFAMRVQALIADDRALIERLIRFAQAHELLKKNAERAQKLAQESSLALETYQKQVKALEERNMGLASSHAMMQDEIHRLQDAVDQITVDKQELEMQAAEQAETCRQLTEANNTLSARALALAEEAATAPEAVKKQLEKQLAECKGALHKAQGEVDAMRKSEQSQGLALLDELNSMQTENDNLRAQLRALGRK